MVESHVIEIGQNIQNIMPEKLSAKESGDKVIVSGMIDAGIKGADVNIECSASTVKVKGTQSYKYPITENSADKFQSEMREKYEDYSVYVSGQTLSFSRYFSYESVSEAVKNVRDALEALTDVVATFEDECVNFLEKNASMDLSTEDYDPEATVNLVNVDNSFHAVSMTEQDNADYEKAHQNFAEQTFDELCTYVEGTKDGNEFTVEKEDGKIIRCILFKMDAEICVSASIKTDSDIAAMYESYIKANYPELITLYRNDSFTVRVYSSPDEYAPEETKEYLDMCCTALDAAIAEYSQNLAKKDSADFASDVQQILAEQTAAMEEREQAMSKREEEMTAKEAEMEQKEAELKKQVEELKLERQRLTAEMDAEKERIREHEEKMQEEIQKYQDRNTKDILAMQQLANQVSALQNRQNALGQSDNDAEEEIQRLKSKVQQLTSQKIALEKKLTEKIANRDGKIRQLSDVVAEKDAEIKKINTNIDDMVKSKTADELKKSEAQIAELERQVNEIGHILTAEDMKQYYEQYTSDTEVNEFHAKNANGVMYNDGALEIRIRIGETDYAEVSRAATLSDKVLRALNAKFSDVKFFSKKDKIIARGYFKKNATPEEVDELVSTISANFTK